MSESLMNLAWVLMSFAVPMGVGAVIIVFATAGDRRI